MLAVLGHQNLGQHRLGGDASGQWPLGCRRLHHRALAAAAPVTRAADPLDPVQRGNDVEHLGHVFADHVHCAAAARAVFVLDIEDDLDPWQMRWQGTAVALRWLAPARRLLVGRRLTRDPCLGGTERLFDLFQPELQLIRIEPLRMRPVAAAHQLLDYQLQLLDLGIGGVALRPERIALPAQPLYCAVLRFQHRHQGSQPRGELDGVLHGLLLAVIGQTYSCPLACQ